ncbi:MAG: SurA N-terminal domain-containing protein [Candidatus Adiutrix sp.]|jgi:hypothetical protein|nr:SurA N-terminal domain-containing protein [Candidatus Adiutrix sp.]
MRCVLWPGLRLAALAALALLATGACREVQEAVWPADTAALVEGRPITMAELKQVLGWGYYGQLDREGASADEAKAVPGLVLDKLIEERLILAEAPRRKISLETAEREARLAEAKEAWSGRDLHSDQAEALRRNLRRQIILHKITDRIMADERRFSDVDWRAFWRAWPKKKPTRYLVRVLFMSPLPEAPVLPEPVPTDLERLAQKFKLEGYPAVLSEAVWLQSDLLDSGLIKALETAWAGRRLSPPLRQESSWAIYEVLRLDRKTAAVAELKAARAAYELKAGEEAFREWLTARRAAADIRINPNLTQTLE